MRSFFCAVFFGALIGVPIALSAEFEWSFREDFPKPIQPIDNTMSAEKVELGRYLFYDKRFSANGEMSCASCHQQALAFSDGRKTAIGVTDEEHPRNTPSLGNVAYRPVLTWAHPQLTKLEDQFLVPLLGRNPVEMGMADQLPELLAIVRNDKIYRVGFKRAFGTDNSITLSNIGKALASFQRTLITARSAYDKGTLSLSAKRGEAVFFSEKLNCFQCHAAPFFTDTVSYEKLGFKEIAFHNIGLYNIDGKGTYPPGNTGLHVHTDRSEDMGRFRTPSLRNVEVTAPYMHDGSVQTLSEVIDIYAAGGRQVGRSNPFKSVFVSGFELSTAQKSDLIEFLKSLTDQEFLYDPRFSDPFVQKQ